MTFLAKIFDNVYKHHAVICISILILRISLRLVDIAYFFKISRPKQLFSIVPFSNYKKGFQKSI